MTRSTWRSQRVATPALLILALAITTGWTPAAQPTAQLEQLDPVAAMPAAAAHLSSAERQLATAHQLASIRAAQISSEIVAHRESELALATHARAFYQSRVIASRAEAPAPAPVKAKAKAKAPVVKATVKTAAKTYTGKNHFWFPAIGISRAVYSFPCSRTREPDNYVYRWGCAGANNVYLLGHAWGVFKPLHDAYLRGRLKVGMIAYYADSNGHVRKYKVTTWRVVNPVDSAWSIASQSVPSMTLQTCVGLNRLNVRLVAVN